MIPRAVRLDGSQGAAAADDGATVSKEPVVTSTTDVLADALQRVADELPDLLEGLDADDLTKRPSPDANPIGWLVWHLTRVQDGHVADLARTLGVEPSAELWGQGWRERFALPYPDDASGYGQSSDEVGAFRAEPQLLLDYHAAVQQATVSVLSAVDDGQLDTVVDTRWDPPVTAAARLVSVVNDTTQHLGQAAYAKGLIGK